MHWDDFSAFDFVDEMVFVLGPDSDNRPILRFLNRAALGRLGKRRDEVDGRPAHKVFSGRAALSVYRRHCAAWAGGVPTEFQIALHLKAETIWAQSRLHPVRDPDGTLTHMVGTSRDITKDHHQLHDRVLSDAALQDAEDLICLAAHDLRSPLCNLKSLAQMMRKDFVDHGDGKAELIDMVDNISDKALTVISGIMGQAIAVGETAEHSRFDFGDMCDDVMVMLDPMDVHSASYPRMELEAELVAVQIVLRNLIDNALKHSGQAVAQISIDVAAVNAERLQITVRDDGVGFDGVGRESGQSGFGLTGLRRLLRARGGTLSIGAKESGQGAQIKVELPGRIASNTMSEMRNLRAS